MKIFSNRKQVLFCTFLLVLSLVQSFYFLVPTNELLKTKIAYAVSTFVFYLLLGSFSKKILQIFIILSFLITCFVFPTLQIYGAIGYNYISAIFYTNTAEAVSYLKMLDSSILIPLFLLAMYSFFLVRKSMKICFSRRIKICLLLLLIAIPLLRIFIPYQTRLYQCFYVVPINKVLKISSFYADVLKEYEFIHTEIVKKSSWKIVEKPQSTSTQNIVVVIGESVRKDFLHSYGFSLENTPFIDNSNKVQFDNYFAVSHNTVPSLLRTISLSKNLIDYEINNNIISLAKQLGYRTYWLSNQGVLGKVNSPISVIGLQADEHFFLTKDEYSNHLDRELLPLFNKVLKNEKTPKMIVLHRFGSHPSVCDRTGGSYDKFVQSDEVSCYNQSIKNLDKFLEKIYTELVKTNEDFTLLYFSDHGLKIRENKTFVHASDCKGIYTVPLLVWSNKMTTSTQITATRTAKDFLHLFSQILGVKTENLQRTYKFISEDKNDDKGIQIVVDTPDKNLVLKNFEELGDNPIIPIFQK
ncbi:MAG: phosphoethanolamine transferase [Flavobacteriaceae bacterium]|nr:phosphoethanolamine transferase [Flavobacteriaceae bacterium]